MNTAEILNLIAIIVIPIAAVLIGQYLQSQAEKRKDKFGISERAYSQRLFISRNNKEWRGLPLWKLAIFYPKRNRTFMCKRQDSVYCLYKYLASGDKFASKKYFYYEAIQRAQRPCAYST